MAMETLTVKGVERLYKATVKHGATPHRTPDFKKILRMVEGDPEVRGRLYFIEEHNTGYDGLLERWMFRVYDHGGAKIEFWADLLPGLITPHAPPVIPVAAA